MMATSARPVRKSSEHWDGTVKDKSYFPCNGPFVKPQTSGAVFRYWTIEMRSLVTRREVTCKFQYNKGGFCGRQPSLARNRSADSERWKNSKNWKGDATPSPLCFYKRLTRQDLGGDGRLKV